MRGVAIGILLTLLLSGCLGGAQDEVAGAGQNEANVESSGFACSGWATERRGAQSVSVPPTPSPLQIDAFDVDAATGDLSLDASLQRTVMTGAESVRLYVIDGADAVVFELRLDALESSTGGESQFEDPPQGTYRAYVEHQAFALAEWSFSRTWDTCSKSDE